MLRPGLAVYLWLTVIVTSMMAFQHDDDVMLDEDEIENTVQLTKRLLTANDKRLWTKGIVPYIFLDNSLKASVEPVMRQYERDTCLRFLPWRKDLGPNHDQTTNQVNGLDHPNHLQFVKGPGCWSWGTGNHRTKGQTISCCGGLECVHEIGHAMGAHHEHQNPLGHAYVRINKENTQPGKTHNFLYRYNQFSLGYNSESIMHYGQKGFNINGLESISKKVSDLRIEMGDFFYLMKEISIRHNCHGIYCSSFTMKCVNDGYLTLVDGKCGCRCPRGLDPSSGCAKVMKNTSYKTRKWPAGSFALPESQTGCPDGNFKKGSRSYPGEADKCTDKYGQCKRYLKIQKRNGKGDTCTVEPGWAKQMCLKTCGMCKLLACYTSDSFHAAGKISMDQVENKFCVKDASSDQRSSTSWTGPGDYCIYRKGGSCPQGFKQGSVEFKFKTSLKSKYTSSGSQPDGNLKKKLNKFDFCCRTSAGFGEAQYLALPTTKPFFLFGTTKQCPRISGMVSSKEFMVFNDFGKGRARITGATPIKMFGDLGQYKFVLCHYTPANTDCGGEIELSTSKSTIEIGTEASNNGKICHWLIKAPDSVKMVIKFQKFEMMSGGCEEYVSIRRNKIGSPEERLCKGWMVRSFSSLNSTIMISHMTKDNTTSSFKATITALLPEDMCYDVKDNGLTYAGDVTFTRPRAHCLPWANTLSCLEKEFPYKLRNIIGSLDSNKCRNPGGDDLGPWCYTSLKNCRRDYCDVCLKEDPYDVSNNCHIFTKYGMCGNDPNFDTMCAGSCKKSLKTFNILNVQSTKCGAPGPIKDGQIKDTVRKTYSVGNVVTYTCSSHKQSRERRCLTNGQWSKLKYACQVPTATTKEPTTTAEETTATVHPQILLRRVNGLIDFDQDWTAYKNGFGDCHTGDCWLGLETLHDLCAKNCLVEITMSYKGSNYHADYTTFKIGPESDNYRMTISGYSGNAGDDMSAKQNNMEFSTTDRGKYGKFCAAIYTGGWWYHKCHDAHLTGLFGSKEYGKGMNWFPLNNHRDSLSSVTMRVTPVHTGGGDLCDDIVDTCIALYEENPAICSQSVEFKDICKSTCGSCKPTECIVEKASANTEMSKESSKIKQGNYVNYECKTGFEYVSGQKVRGCLATGKMTRESLICKENSTMKSIPLAKGDTKSKWGKCFTGDLPYMKIPHSGKIIRWEFYSIHNGKGAFQVWSPLGNGHLKLIGQTMLEETPIKAQATIYLSGDQQISVSKGDYIGIYYGKGRTMGVNAKKCDIKKNPEYKKMLKFTKKFKSANQFKVGQSYKFKSAKAKKACMDFPFRAVIE